MAEKTRYSDAELEEFRAIIMEKLDKAKKDYDLLRSGITNADGNDVSDTSPTFKVMEEGVATLSKEEAQGAPGHRSPTLPQWRAACPRSAP